MIVFYVLESHLSQYACVDNLTSVFPMTETTGFAHMGINPSSTISQLLSIACTFLTKTACSFTAVLNLLVGLLWYDIDNASLCVFLKD